MSDLICSKIQLLLTRLSFCPHQRSAASSPTKLGHEWGFPVGTRALPGPPRNPTRTPARPPTLEPSSLSSPAIFMSQVPQPSGSRSVQQSATARAEDLVRLGAWGRGDFGEAPVWPLVLLVQSMRSPTGAGPLLRPSPSPAPRPAASAGTQLLGADGR